MIADEGPGSIIGRRPRLARESDDGFLVLQHLREESLDGDLGAELHVTSGDDDAHATGTKDVLDAVLAADGLAFAEGGGVGFALRHCKSGDWQPPVRCASIRRTAFWATR